MMLLDSPRSILLCKLALLAEWQYLCHDDFDEEEDMNEKQYWNYLNEKTVEQLQRMADDDFEDGRTPEGVLECYAGYLSHCYIDLLTPQSDESARA